MGTATRRTTATPDARQNCFSSAQTGSDIRATWYRIILEMKDEQTVKKSRQIIVETTGLKAGYVFALSRSDR
jgi:hypothetical protein